MCGDFQCFDTLSYLLNEDIFITKWYKRCKSSILSINSIIFNNEGVKGLLTHDASNNLLINEFFLVPLFETLLNQICLKFLISNRVFKYYSKRITGLVVCSDLILCLNFFLLLNKLDA